jgi:hypothetical protein
MEMSEGLLVIVEKCLQPISRSEMASEAAGDCYKQQLLIRLQRNNREKHILFFASICRVRNSRLAIAFYLSW